MSLLTEAERRNMTAVGTSRAAAMLASGAFATPAASAGPQPAGVPILTGEQGSIKSISIDEQPDMPPDKQLRTERVANCKDGNQSCSDSVGMTEAYLSYVLTNDGMSKIRVLFLQLVCKALITCHKATVIDHSIKKTRFLSTESFKTPVVASLDVKGTLAITVFQQPTEEGKDMAVRESIKLTLQEMPDVRPDGQAEYPTALVEVGDGCVYVAAQNRVLRVDMATVLSNQHSSAGEHPEPLSVSFGNLPEGVTQLMVTGSDVTALAVHPCGHEVAAGDADGTIHVTSASGPLPTAIFEATCDGDAPAADKRTAVTHLAFLACGPVTPELRIGNSTLIAALRLPSGGLQLSSWGISLDEAEDVPQVVPVDTVHVLRSGTSADMDQEVWSTLRGGWIMKAHPDGWGETVAGVALVAKAGDSKVSAVVVNKRAEFVHWLRCSVGAPFANFAFERSGELQSQRDEEPDPDSLSPDISLLLRLQTSVASAGIPRSLLTPTVAERPPVQARAASVADGPALEASETVSDATVATQLQEPLPAPESAAPSAPVAGADPDSTLGTVPEEAAVTNGLLQGAPFTGTTGADLGTASAPPPLQTDTSLVDALVAPAPVATAAPVASSGTTDIVASLLGAAEAAPLSTATPSGYVTFESGPVRPATDNLGSLAAQALLPSSAVAPGPDPPPWSGAPPGQAPGGLAANPLQVAPDSAAGGAMLWSAIQAEPEQPAAASIPIDSVMADLLAPEAPQALHGTGPLSALVPPAISAPPVPAPVPVGESLAAPGGPLMAVGDGGLRSEGSLVDALLSGTPPHMSASGSTLPPQKSPDAIGAAEAAAAALNHAMEVSPSAEAPPARRPIAAPAPAAASADLVHPSHAPAPPSKRHSSSLAASLAATPRQSAPDSPMREGRAGGASDAKALKALERRMDEGMKLTKAVQSCASRVQTDVGKVANDCKLLRSQVTALERSIKKIEGSLDRLPQDLSAAVSQGLASALPVAVREQVAALTADAFRDAFSSAIVPAFQQALQSMFTQVDRAVNAGLSEHLAATRAALDASVAARTSADTGVSARAAPPAATPAAPVAAAPSGAFPAGLHILGQTGPPPLAPAPGPTGPPPSSHAFTAAPAQPSSAATGTFTRPFMTSSHNGAHPSAVGQSVSISDIIDSEPSQGHNASARQAPPPQPAASYGRPRELQPFSMGGPADHDMRLDEPIETSGRGSRRASTNHQQPQGQSMGSGQQGPFPHTLPAAPTAPAPAPAPFSSASPPGLPQAPGAQKQVGSTDHVQALLSAIRAQDTQAVTAVCARAPASTASSLSLLHAACVLDLLCPVISAAGAETQTPRGASKAAQLLEWMHSCAAQMLPESTDRPGIVREVLMKAKTAVMSLAQGSGSQEVIRLALQLSQLLSSRIQSFPVS